MEEEIWLDILEYEGLYQVSSLGRIKSLERTVHRGRGVGATVTKPEKILIPQENKNGYGRVNLYDHRVRIKSFRINRLVAQAFLELDIKSTMIVMHLDNNPRNNNLSNLRVGTSKENIEQRDREGRKASTKGVLNGMSKCSEDEIIQTRVLWETGMYTISSLAKYINKSYHHVYEIVNNLKWRHLQTS